MSGINQDRIGIKVPVDSIALGVWGNNADQELIASLIVPNNPYLELDQGKIFLADGKTDQVNDKPTAPLEAAPQINYSENSVDYKRVAHRRTHVITSDKLRTDLPKALAKTKAQQTGVRVVTTNLKKVFEYKMANKVFNTNIFHNTVAGTLWSNASSSTPVKDLNNEASIISLQTSYRVNTIIFGVNAYKYYVSNDKILNSIKNTEDALVKRARALDLMRSDKLENLQYMYVAGASTNRANVGQDEDRAFLWNPNLIWIGYIEQNPTGEDMSTSIALSTEFFTDSMGQKSPVEIRSIIPEQAEKGTEIIEGMIKNDIVVVNPKMGRILTVGG